LAEIYRNPTIKDGLFLLTVDAGGRKEWSAPFGAGPARIESFEPIHMSLHRLRLNSRVASVIISTEKQAR
jgi:hypothetical protein